MASNSINLLVDSKPVLNQTFFFFFSEGISVALGKGGLYKVPGFENKKSQLEKGTFHRMPPEFNIAQNISIEVAMLASRAGEKSRTKPYYASTMFDR